MIEEDFRHLALSMTRATDDCKWHEDVDLNAESSHRAANRAATSDIAWGAPGELA